MKTFIQEILGDLSIMQFAVSLFWAIWGIMLVLLYDSTTRKPLKNNSPVPFSLSYFIKDNLKKTLLSLMLIITAIIFCKQVLNVDLNNWYSLGIGLSFDIITLILKKKFSFLKGIIDEPGKDKDDFQDDEPPVVEPDPNNPVPR
jgi:hypothetical protein